jgi:hypothetical protein
MSELFAVLELTPQAEMHDQLTSGVRLPGWLGPDVVEPFECQY